MPPQATTIPVNSDSVECSPIFNIRESQNPRGPINTFGNGNGTGLAQNAGSQFSGNTPGPPFHVSSVNNLDMNPRGTSFLSPQLSPNGGLAQARSSISQDFTQTGFPFNDGGEMDISGDGTADRPSPQTLSSQSRGGSTSLSSHSPRQQTEHHLPYRASPKMPLGQMQSGDPSTASVFTNFSSSSEIFENTFTTSGSMNGDSFQQNFMVGNEWEYTAMNTGTGLTPTAESSWDSMLQSVTMGWDPMGPPHGPTPGAR